MNHYWFVGLGWKRQQIKHLWDSKMFHRCFFIHAGGGFEKNTAG